MSASPGYVAGEKRTTREVLRELLRGRGVLWVLIRRDLKVRYAESLLGYVWSVLEPLMMGAVYWFVFTVIVKRSIGEDPYIIFLLSGLLPWMWFTSGLTEGAKALHSQRRLIASTALPRQIWVFRSIGSKGIEFLLSIPVFVVFLLIYPPQYDAEVLLVLVGIVVQLTLLLGFGFLLSPIMMLYRDVDPLIRIAVRFLFYASPIIYSINDVLATGMPDFVKFLYKLNPVTGIMECYRAGFFAGPTNFDTIAYAAVISVVVLVLGWVVFARMERQVLKEI